MKAIFRKSAAFFIFFSCVGTIGHAQSTTGNAELNEGTQAYREARYQDAIQHFQRVVSLDPQNKIAHLYLATALVQEYIPGVAEQGNIQIAQSAIEQYQDILNLDPKSRDAIKGLAYLYLQLKRFDEAKDQYLKLIQSDPHDPENYYSIGVIDWTQSYQPRMELRAKLVLDPTTPLIHAVECWQLRDVTEAMVKDGIEQLTEAIKLRPDYDDAMAYMNLLFRERADIQCNDKDAYDADLKTADKWVDLTLQTKKQKSERSQLPSQSDSATP